MDAEHQRPLTAKGIFFFFFFLNLAAFGHLPDVQNTDFRQDHARPCQNDPFGTNPRFALTP